LNLDLPLHYGGPFNTDMISFIHTDSTIKDAIPVGELLFGGNYEFLTSMAQNSKLDLNRIRFYAGFVQWTAGQLQDELQEEKWWVSKMTADEYFTATTNDLWSYQLLRNGNMYGLLNEYPDPGTN